MFDSCRGHSQSLYPSRSCSFRRPICAEWDFLNSCFLNFLGAFPPQRADRTDSRCCVPDVHLRVPNPLGVCELLRESELVSGEEPGIDVVEASDAHDRVDAGFTFLRQQALMACSETPMTLAASRALHWWK